MPNRGDVAEDIMGVLSRNKLDVPEALIALADTVLGIYLTYGIEPHKRENLISSLEIFNMHCMATYDEFVADGGLEEVERDAGREVMQ
jgi:hypothetical protein